MTKVLFLAKKTDICNRAVDYMKAHFSPELTVVQGDRGEVFPAAAEAWEGELIISFLSPWVIPEKVLKRAKLFAINFHPAPPAYPGIGCYNFALYDEQAEYGATCHHMEKLVDSGAIVAVKTFVVDPAETVLSLKEKSMKALWDLFVEVMQAYLKKQKLPQSTLQWTRKPYTRRQLNELCRITNEMDAKEIAKRVRATYFPGAPGPNVTIGDYIFEYKGKKNDK